MVVDQEMAEIYPPDADDISEYLPGLDCGTCGYKNCIEFAEALLEKKTTSRDCTELKPELADLITSVINLDTSPIPYNIMMEQIECHLIEIEQPTPNSPVLVTGNFRETVRIVKSILEKTSTRSFLLPTHTHGYSVDNAVHERMFKAVEIWKALKENAVESMVRKPILVIPGIAEFEKNSIRQLTRWEVLVGPVSGFLLPLFIRERGDIFSDQR